MSETIPFLSESLSQCELTACGLTLRYRSSTLTSKQWNKLVDHAQKVGVIEKQTNMMHGAVVNKTENRQALHTSLRSKSPRAPYFDEVQSALGRMKQFAKKVRNGQWRGATGKRITDVINVGVEVMKWDLMRFIMLFEMLSRIFTCIFYLLLMAFWWIVF